MGRILFLVAIFSGLMLVGAGCDESDPGRCPIEECYRAISCVEECGGPVVRSSCCPCPTGTVDEIDCTPDRDS